MKGWTWAAVGLLVLLIALGVAWIFTGGIAVEHVQKFEQTDRQWRDGEEALTFRLEGRESETHIPFLFSRYSEKGPFRLAIQRSDPAPTWREVRLHSVKVSWPGDAGVELVPRNVSIALQWAADKIKKSTPEGIVWTSSFTSSYTFGRELAIPFSEGLAVTCEVDLELVGEGGSKRIRVTAELVGRERNHIGTCWEHIAGS